MKKSLSIFLLLCLMAPLLGFWGWLNVRKHLVKKQVKRQIMAGIDKEKLVLLEFSEVDTATKLRWEHSKEFEYRGQMYDIVKKQAQGDSLYYWCWWDHEETQLNQQLAILAKITFDKDPQKREKQNKLTDFYKSLYFLESIDKEQIWLAQKNQYLKSNQFLRPQSDAKPPVPPPQYFI